MNRAPSLKRRTGSGQPQNEMLKDYLLLYLKNYYYIVPDVLLYVLIVALIIGAIGAFSIYGLKKGFRVFSVVVVVEVVVLILSSTVFLRELDEGVGYNLTPFWSYRMPSRDLQNSMYVENLMNVLMFIPLGIALECSFRDMTWKRVFFFAWGLSFSIEILQFILKKGFAEFDDVFHNVLGCLIGFGICKVVVCLIK